ncbi:MAG: fibronectin I domain-containing [Geobacteraceae bacterium]|nr:MAG: fibronectin I domain-containing [Geobacteraceae bacterium]
MSQDCKMDMSGTGFKRRGSTPCITMMRPLLLLLAALMSGFVVSAAAYAKGSDPFIPFPTVDTRAGEQYAKAMAVDSEGNIIVVGSTNTGGGSDYQVAKFKADGTGLAWTPVVFGAAGNDVATAVVADSLKNIIVTGYTWNGTNYDIHTIKYSGATGAVMWEHTFDDGAANGDDWATAIAVDGSDDIYVAGYSANGIQNDDFLIVKYPSGSATPAWVELTDDTAYPNNNNRLMAISAGVGGIAVTGHSSKGGSDFDVITRKYGFDKTLIREWRYSSTGSRDDRGLAVKMDSAGYVIATGYVTNGSSNKDMFTAKYDPSSSTPVWQKMYDNNGSSGDDEPRGLWVDGAGDVYVTGSTTTLDGNADIYTARYPSAGGAAVWETVFNVGDGSADIPVGIVVDDAVDGGVFVTGYTTVSSNEDFLTLKYRKDNGLVLWQKSLNGSGSRNDRPIGIALEPAAGTFSPRSVCVAGWSDSAATGNDFTAVKYDFGALNAPTKLTATVASNTSITLTWSDNSINEERFVIQRKLGQDGTWGDIATVNSPAPPNSTGTVTYTDDSPPLTPNKYYYYQVRANNTANGDTYYSKDAHALTKVVSYETPAWSYTYDGADHLEDIATAITFGSDNHPVVTGQSDLTEEGLEPGPNTHTFDYMTFKLDRDSKAVKWKARYDSEDGGTDMAAGVALDSSGNVLVTGTAYLAGGGDRSDDLYTRKVRTSTITDPNAVPEFMWDFQYGTLNGIDQATAISMIRDGSDNSVVIGFGNNTSVPPNDDIFIMKLGDDGTRPWTPIVYNSGRSEQPSAVAFDSAGNIFVAGYIFDQQTPPLPAINFDWFTAKYDGATGALIWSEIYNVSQSVYGVASGDDQAFSIDVDAAGNAYVTGFATNAAGERVFYTVKYDGATVPAGNRRIWEKPFNYTGFDAEAAAIRVDPIGGAVVVAGTAYVSATDSDFHLIRYNPDDGSLVSSDPDIKYWDLNFDRPESYEYVTAMTVDSSGYIYVTGNTRSGPDTDPAFDGTSNIMSLIYDHEGTFLGAMTYDGTGRRDEATAITANYVGEAFIAGFTNNAANNPDYAVLKQTNGYLLVPAPFIAMSQADAGKVDLSWQHNNPSATFIIERTPGPATPVSTWTEINRPAASATSFTDTSLTPDTSYCYRINAILDSLPSRKVVRCVTTRLLPPVLAATIVDPDLVNQKITLNWSQVTDNAGYKIERKTGPGGTWGDLVTKGTNVTSHEDTSSLTRGTVYYYRVSANGPGGYSLPSNEKSGITAPTLNAPASITNNQMTLTWAGVAGAASYTVEKKLSGESFGPVAGCTAITGATCTATGLTPLGQYVFHVKATDASGDSPWSNETSAQAVLGVPTLNAPSSITKNSMYLSWSAVSGAGVTSYPLEYKEEVGGTWTDSGCPANTNLYCTVSLPNPDKTYYFHVKARNASGDSSWSTPDRSAKTLLPEPVLTSVTGTTTTNIDLVWTDNATTENNYVIERNPCSDPNNYSASCAAGTNYTGSWSVITSGTRPADSTTWSDNSAAAGIFYRYRVKATTSAGNVSVYSNELYASTRLAQPTMSSVVPASTTSLTATWTDVTGETTYTLERKQGTGGTYAPVPGATNLTKNTLTYTDSDLSLSTEYCYRIQASTSFGVPSVYSSNELCRTTPLSAPTQATPTVLSSTQIQLDWSQVPSNTGYEVERCVTTDNNQPITHPLGACTNLTPKLGTDVITYTNTVTAGYTYRYRVRAWFNASQEYTAWSNEYWATAKPPAPTLGTPTAASATQLNLSWNNVYGDNGYSLYWKQRSGATCTDDTWSGPIALGLNATSYSHTGRTAGTFYCYKIKANGPAGPPVTPDSDFSAIVTQTTLISAPTLNPPSGITASNVCLSWTNVMPNTAYKVERKTGSSGTWAQVGSDLPANNIDPTVTWCNSSGLSSGTLYYYRFYIKNAGGYSPVSNEQSVTTTPAIPSITATAISEDEIDICWPLAYGATNYKVDRKTGSEGTYGQIANPSVSYTTSYCGEPYPTVACPTASAVVYCYPDAGLTKETTYYYRVRSGNGTDSPDSTEQSATTLSIPNQNLTATSLDGGFKIQLAWSPIVCSPDPCDNPDFFEIQRQVRDAEWVALTTVDGATFTYIDTLAIDPTKKYRYRIRALKGALQSPFSEATAFANPYATGANVCR